MTRLACTALCLSLALVSCRTAPERKSPPPAASEELRRAVRQALLALPEVEDEAFDDYLARARAAMAADDREPVRALVAYLPDDPHFFREGLAGFVAPVLLSSWARSRSATARVEALAALIRHETTNAPGSETPGRTPAFDAFEADLKARAEGLGLAFLDVDHVAYEVSLPGQLDLPRARQVGVLVHADVVPADEPGWSVAPFEGVVREDRVIGRGAMDDKGPLVASLFTLAALSHSGVPFRRAPVLVVGTSEETHWEGIERLVAARGLPEALFVADGDFPVGIGEKGIATVRLKTTPFVANAAHPPGTQARLVAIQGGQVSNQVPATAEARLSPGAGTALEAFAQALEEKAKARGDMALLVDVVDGAARVRAQGTAAHSAEPTAGHNAISDLLRFLSQDLALEESPCARLARLLDARLGLSTSGAGLGVTDAHPAFTPATVSLGLFTLAPDGSCTATLNVRWPPPRKTAEVVSAIEAAVKEAAKEAAAPGEPPVEIAVQGGGLDPYLVDESSSLVRSLLSAYGTVTGAAPRAVTLSGTTYAKAVPGGGVTFGPGEAGSGGARIHAPDEHITLEELSRLVEVYTFALAELGRRPQ